MFSPQNFAECTLLQKCKSIPIVTSMDFLYAAFCTYKIIKPHKLPSLHLLACYNKRECLQLYSVIIILLDKFISIIIILTKLCIHSYLPK